MAMFDYWENGTIPCFPKKLQDKWRFLYNSLKQSRSKAYAKLGETPEEIEQELTDHSSDSSSKQTKNISDNQGVNSNLCPQSKHNLSTNRIENKEEKNKNDNYSYSDSINHRGNTIKDEDHHYIPPYDDDWKEIMEQQQDKRRTLNSSSHQPSLSPSILQDGHRGTSPGTDRAPSQPSPSIPRDAHRVATSANDGAPSQPSTPIVGNTGNDIEHQSELILSRIVDKYTNIGKPVSYTYSNAQQELNMPKDVFYKVINHLTETGKLECKKVVLTDGREINSFTPKVKSSTRRFLLPRNYIQASISLAESTVYEYFQKHPFYYDPSWDQKTFLNSNRIPLAAAYKELIPTVTRYQEKIDAIFWNIIVNCRNRGLNLLEKD